jgi:hypothetical protein
MASYELPPAPRSTISPGFKIEAGASANIVSGKTDGRQAVSLQFVNHLDEVGRVFPHIGAKNGCGHSKGSVGSSRIEGAAEEHAAARRACRLAAGRPPLKPKPFCLLRRP